jgi:outer membrane protein assembly factor BamD
MAAFGYYQRNEYDDAIVALDRFIQLHPSNRDTPYAYYLKALSYYEQISDVERDQKMTESALKTLEELIARYPDSKYARDAKVKLDLTYDHLAGKTMEIGRYYLRRGYYLAAVNRFKSVVDNYQTTTHVPEALHRLVEAYLALGLEEEARKSAAVLGHNFPGSEWYIDSYELVELKRVRESDRPWYAFWGSDDTDTIEVKKLEADEEPWYKFW